MQNWCADSAAAADIVLSGFDGVFTRRREPLPEELDKAEKIMCELDCAKLAQQPFASLSSGEQVKIYFARALVTSPQLLILDEACVHLDFRSREYVLQAVDELAAAPQAPTIIFITQRIEDIGSCFRHGLVLADGAVIARGSKEDILTPEILSATFGVKLQVHKTAAGRYWPLPE
jgi:iron complex transport system ATP-binding protein